MGRSDTPGKLISADRSQGPGAGPSAGEPSPASGPWAAEAALEASVPYEWSLATILWLVSASAASAAQGPLAGYGLF